MHSGISSLASAASIILSAVFAVRPRPVCAEHKPSPRPGKADQLVLAVAGDVLPESNWSLPADPERLLNPMRQEFARADLVFVNLEEPVTTGETVTSGKEPRELEAEIDYVLRARNTLIPAHLRDSGVGLVGLANNHMMDYSEPGLQDTLAAFKTAGLPAIGAGARADAERPYVFTKGGRRVALLAFSDVVPRGSRATRVHPGIASSKATGDVVNAVRRARAQADFVVAIVHWGGQGTHLITPRQRQLARILVQAGCDAIVGMHPHVLQGIEYIDSVPVFYSIGNFAFPAVAASHRESLLVRLVFGRSRLDQVEFVPVEISRGSPHPARGMRAREILGNLNVYCGMFNTRVRDGRLERGPVRQTLQYYVSQPLPAQKLATRMVQHRIATSAISP